MDKPKLKCVAHSSDDQECQEYSLLHAWLNCWNGWSLLSGTQREGECVLILIYDAMYAFTELLDHEINILEEVCNWWGNLCTYRLQTATTCVKEENEKKLIALLPLYSSNFITCIVDIFEFCSILPNMTFSNVIVFNM